MEQITEIEVSKIKPNQKQPRKDFDKKKLIELANSIKQNGLINPIQVIKKEKGYEIICGERRWRAYRLLKFKKIKAIIKNYNSDEEKMVESLIENLHRTNLNSIEKENFISALWETGRYKTKTSLSKAIGVDDNHAKNILLAKQIRDKVKPAKNISTRTIRDTFIIQDLKDVKQILNKVEKKQLLPSKVEAFSRIISNSPKEVKEALFKDKITLTQATSILKIKDEKFRNKIIQAHQEIKNIDKGIEKTIVEETDKPKPNQDRIIRTKESLKVLRKNIVESEKTIHTAIRGLMNCFSYLNLMDKKQISTLKHNQELFDMVLSNALSLLENSQNKIKDY